MKGLKLVKCFAGCDRVFFGNKLVEAMQVAKLSPVTREEKHGSEYAVYAFDSEITAARAVRDSIGR